MLTYPILGHSISKYLMETDLRQLQDLADQIDREKENLSSKFPELVQKSQQIINEIFKIEGSYEQRMAEISGDLGGIAVGQTMNQAYNKLGFFNGTSVRVKLKEELLNLLCQDSKSP